jgi:hypothetical protein
MLIERGELHQKIGQLGVAALGHEPISVIASLSTARLAVEGQGRLTNVRKGE